MLFTDPFRLITDDVYVEPTSPFAGYPGYEEAVADPCTPECLDVDGCTSSELEEGLSCP